MNCNSACVTAWNQTTAPTVSFSFSLLLFVCIVYCGTHNCVVFQPGVKNQRAFLIYTTSCVGRQNSKPWTSLKFKTLVAHKHSIPFHQFQFVLIAWQSFSYFTDTSVSLFFLSLSFFSLRKHSLITSSILASAKRKRFIPVRGRKLFIDQCATIQDCLGFCEHRVLSLCSSPAGICEKSKSTWEVHV